MCRKKTGETCDTSPFSMSPCVAIWRKSECAMGEQIWIKGTIFFDKAVFCTRGIALFAYLYYNKLCIGNGGLSCCILLWNRFYPACRNRHVTLAVSGGLSPKIKITSTCALLFASPTCMKSACRIWVHVFCMGF